MASSALVKLQHKLQLAKKSSARARAKAGELMEQALETGITGGTALALGFWEGGVTDKKQFEFFNVPAPLAIGVAAHAAAMFGVGRGMESHFRSVGNGAIAAHLNGLGRYYGAKRAADAGKSPLLNSQARVSGEGLSTADVLRNL